MIFDGSNDLGDTTRTPITRESLEAAGYQRHAEMDMYGNYLYWEKDMTVVTIRDGIVSVGAAGFFIASNKPIPHIENLEAIRQYFIDTNITPTQKQNFKP